ncbi:MAG: tRNA (adenosine(37)-N6)-threonylcarbamoyltransferase complex transferase subunit TsaD [Planctomycetia bacterium]|nr:tRNA (adenosine(37)-N6)-threonylcarbamoyltransferase complex transferase subunit TsaD [Planctomycetia bacterium]
MYLLTLESSCDETAAAVIRDDGKIQSEVVASQAALHAEYGGVVPELASRAHMERILPVMDQVVKKAGISLAQIDAVAVANTPGLAGSLLVGLVAAKTLALVLGKPLIAINHLQAHIYACQVAAGENIFPCVGLIVSGGHTSLYRCNNALDFELLGTTIDDAAGEAFDKVAAMLGLPYPGGPNIQRCAEQGNPHAYAFPRAFLHEKERLQFSFSGLKTAVRYQLVGTGRQSFEELHLDDTTRANLAASFQEAVVDALATKALHALRLTRMNTLCVGGGVAANRALRERLESDAKRYHYQFRTAPLKLCTDNAVMGAIAWERFHAGLFEDLRLDIQPGVVRKNAAS